jgi:hypothetical protein
VTRWGLYGSEPALEAWLRRFAESAALPAFLAPRDGFGPTTPADLLRVEWCDRWESLLADAHLAGLIVTAADDAECAVVRQLAQGDTPLDIRPRAAMGLSFAYELTLLSAEQAVPFRALWPTRDDGALSRLKQWLTSADRGLTHVELTRLISVTGLASREVDQRVAAVQLDDLDLLSWLGVRGKRITALSTARPEPTHRRLTVTLQADQGPAGLWNLETTQAATSTTTLALETTLGRITLEQSPTGAWRFRVDSVRPADLAEPGSYPAQPDHHTSWEAAVHIFEWVDAIGRSLERRRAIELESEPLSERTIFKTQMAALGCGVLMATLVLGVGYLFLAELVPLPGWLLHLIRGLVFAPLFLFLLAQLLLPLSRGRPRAS